jgi:hypothetical protein
MMGICELCHESGKELRRSHFIPSSFYKLLATSEYEPVRVSKEAMFPTSKQTQDHVFCGDCEHIFNRGGENWLRPLMPTIGGPFPLRERLMQQSPMYRDVDFALYATATNPSN